MPDCTCACQQGIGTLPPFRRRAYYASQKSGLPGQPLVFADVTFEQAREVFARLDAQSVPYIVHWTGDFVAKGSKTPVPPEERLTSNGSMYK